ncbi:MAG: ABC transporter ATP-binding protein [Mesorhizobium amorphae]|nr:MAG: ABC transporter ATP-binding protein [Mesorhizobium amorphae]
MTSLLQATSLSFRGDGGAALVEDVSISVRAGDRLAIIGPNGAGKTTLLRMLSGMLRPHRGAVLLEGDDLSRMKPIARARRIAVVGQSDQPDLRLSVWDYVGLGRIPHTGLRSRSVEWGIINDALRAAGLESFRDRAVATLSGGERQRAQIARAIAQSPDLLFLDEPTNHLDPRARAELLALVAGLPVAVVAVLHDLPLVSPFATHVAVMERARLVASGSPMDALTPATVRRVFGIDILRLPHPAENRELTVFDLPSKSQTTTHGA